MILIVKKIQKMLDGSYFEILKESSYYKNSYYKNSQYLPLYAFQNKIIIDNIC